MTAPTSAPTSAPAAAAPTAASTASKTLYDKLSAVHADAVKGVSTIIGIVKPRIDENDAFKDTATKARECYKKYHHFVYGAVLAFQFWTTPVWFSAGLIAGIFLSKLGKTVGVESFKEEIFASQQEKNIAVVACLAARYLFPSALVGIVTGIMAGNSLICGNNKAPTDDATRSASSNPNTSTEKEMTGIAHSDKTNSARSIPNPSTDSTAGDNGWEDVAENKQQV